MLLPALLRPDRCLHFLRPGRLVAIREGPLDWGWGIVLAVHRLAKTGSSNGIKARACPADDVLLHMSANPLSSC